MARTYRRNTPKSQNKTAHYVKNLCVASQHDSYWFPFVKIRRDNLFFTDNQRSVNWKDETDAMNRKVRYESKRVLKKIKNLEDSEAVVLNFKEKQQMAFEIYKYWD